MRNSIRAHLAVLSAAAAMAATGVANAGSIVFPSPNPIKYAAEAIGPATVVLSRFTYQMGINRVAGANYVFIVTPGPGVTIDPASCIPANLVASTVTNTTFATKVA